LGDLKQGSYTKQKHLALFQKLAHFMEEPKAKSLRWMLFLCISCGLVSGVVNVYALFDQLIFGKWICLLFVEDYRRDSQFGFFIFDAQSPVCVASMSVGSIGLIFFLGIVAVRGYYLLRNQSPSHRLIMSLAIIGSFWSITMAVMASIQTAGLIKTCSEFTKSAKSCGAVFAEGFFAGTTAFIYYKNFTFIIICMVTAWTTFLFWLLYAGHEWYMNSLLVKKRDSPEEPTKDA
jgi:hypothetical protein